MLDAITKNTSSLDVATIKHIAETIFSHTGLLITGAIYPHILLMLIQVTQENLSARPMRPEVHIFLGNFVLLDRIYHPSLG